jgi:hypothetical protein
VILWDGGVPVTVYAQGQWRTLTLHGDLLVHWQSCTPVGAIPPTAAGYPEQRAMHAEFWFDIDKLPILRTVPEVDVVVSL